MAKPDSSEYQSTYVKYYIDLVQGDDALKALEIQLSASLKFLKLLSEEQGNHAYDTGKWTIKEVLGHMIDTERIMAFRALSFGRGEKQPLPGYDENEYMADAGFNQRSLSDIINEYRLVRESNLATFKNFSSELLSRQGIANGNSISVRALLFVIAGHELHHLNVIRTKYLN